MHLHLYASKKVDDPYVFVLGTYHLHDIAVMTMSCRGRDSARLEDSVCMERLKVPACVREYQCQWWI